MCCVLSLALDEAESAQLLFQGGNIEHDSTNIFLIAGWIPSFAVKTGGYCLVLCRNSCDLCSRLFEKCKIEKLGKFQWGWL